MHGVWWLLVLGVYNLELCLASVGTDTLVAVDGHNETVDSIAQPRPQSRKKRSDGQDMSLPGQSSEAVPIQFTPKHDTVTFDRPPTAASRVHPDARSQVEWFDDTQYYALRASSDTKFRVRHAPPPDRGSPWPMPQLYQPTNVSFRVASVSMFEFHSVGEQCLLLEDAFRRFRRNVFGDDSSETDSAYRRATGDLQLEIHSVNVTILKECTHFPHLEMDESYDLEVKRSGVSIITREVWGALRGLETLSQIIYHDDNGLLWVNKTYIRDYPRFKHRGILLDTSRHYLDKETILSNLEAMAINKMNVFHWHIVDDQSFPFQSKVFPNLTRFGAYHPVTHVYTPRDVAEIIEFARVRGIRVVAEFDTPGHTFSWGFGQDHLLTPCYSYRREPNGVYGPINPILKKTYSFLRLFFEEVVTVFKDRYVHLGGDEVPLDCWQSNPFLLNFMKRNNLSEIRELLSLYERELFKIIEELGESRDVGVGTIVWQEVFDSGVKLPLDTIVQIWSGDSYDIDRVTKAGLRALFSTCWYLDYINYGQDWDKYYKCDQVGSQLDDYRVHNQSLLIGGEACLWAEYADDDSVMPRLWPRAAAAAERLWSDRLIVDVHQAAPRIEEQRCRMMRRGIRVGVLSGPGHCPRHRKPSRSFDSPSSVFVQGLHQMSEVIRDSDLTEDLPKLAKQVYKFEPVVVIISLGIVAVVIMTRLWPHRCGTSKASFSHLSFIQRRRKIPLLLVGGVCIVLLGWFLWSATLDLQ